MLVIASGARPQAPDRARHAGDSDAIFRENSDRPHPPRLWSDGSGMRHRVAAASTLLAWAPAVQAQDERPTGYPRSANERPGAAVTLSSVYTGEVRGVLSGGLRRGVRYLDNLDLQVAIDGERAIGWTGGRLFAYAIHNNGVAFSGDLVGDLQTVSNLETGIKATRLFEAWAEQAIGARGSVKAGLYNLNSEFDTTISGGLFLLSSHGIGADLAQSGRNGPSIFPVTSLALRGEWAPSDRLLLRAAVLDGVPGDPARPGATAIRLARGDGALLIGEANYLTRRSKLALGSWRYTARFEPIGAGRPGRGNAGAYALAESQLTGGRARGGAGLAGWVRFGVADRRTNPIAAYLGAGLVQTGVGRARPDDQAGISVALARLGARYRRLERVGRQEIVVEAAYRLAVADWLSVQPGLQLVLQPGGRRDPAPAIVPALRVKLGR